jgi:hypothetical protein
MLSCEAGSLLIRGHIYSSLDRVNLINTEPDRQPN